MSDNNFEFNDTLTYQPPDADDCLIVPEAQWDQLYTNLEKANIFMDKLLWMLCGICGGGFLTYIATFFTLPTDGESIQKPTFLMFSLILLIAAIFFFIVANKLGSGVTAESVRDQMAVLKTGFRKLTKSK